MSRFLSTLVFVLALATLSSHVVVGSPAQNATSPNSPQTGVALIKLSTPIYPPVARQAHITGDVDLMLAIRQDGTVESATVVSGPPLLRSAALDSAQRTQFECRRCSEATSSYRLVYTFQIEGDCGCDPTVKDSNDNKQDQVYPQITEALHRVTLTVHINCTCDPVSTISRRSLKCLYLWRCGHSSME